MPRACRAAWLAIGVFLVALASPDAAPQSSRYLLVAVPGIDRDAVDRGKDAATAIGVSLLVFDVDQNHRIIGRVPIWAPAATSEHVRGLAMAPQTIDQPTSEGPRLYISTTRRLAAIDLASGSVVWEQDYGGHCCERMAVSPDGQTIYAPAFGRPLWYVIDAGTGALLSTIPVLGYPRSTAHAHDDNLAFFAAWESRELLVVDTTSNTVVREVGPFTDYVCPFVISRKAMMAFANVEGLVGFEVGDLLTGLVIERVQIDDYAPGQLEPYECPSHGIAFTPDDAELWVADGVGNRLRVFDARPLPPVHVTSIQLERQPRWVMFGRDGRYAYSSTGDVIDAASKRVVATLEDEEGRIVESERMVEVQMMSPPAGWGR